MGHKWVVIAAKYYSEYSTAVGRSAKLDLARSTFMVPVWMTKMDKEVDHLKTTTTVVLLYYLLVAWIRWCVVHLLLC